VTFTRGRDLSSPAHYEVDAVIVGSGAGGAMAARELSRAGKSVLVLEEGGDHVPADFNQREEQMIPKLFAELGGRRTDDLAVMVLSGRGLGGSTTHNTNLVKRTDPAILDLWREEHGLSGLDASAMGIYFDEVEALLGVGPIPEPRISEHNRVFRRGVEALGYRGGVLSHNRDGRCVGSGFCELGCAYDGKMNARRILLPEASERGATILSDAKATRVLHDGTRASGVSGLLLDEHGRERGTFEVTARAVCLAGSAIGSPALALLSGVPDPHAQIGAHLHLHPGAAIAGIFDQPIEGWRGIPQSYECTEFLDLTPNARRRVWIVPSFAHPVGTAANTPGFGPDLMRSMRNYPNMAVLAAMVHDESEGTVYVSGERPRIAYRPSRPDREQLALGAREAARILFSAGAREVMIPAMPPIVLRELAEIDDITSDRFLPHDAALTAVHPMGSMRMGADPSTSATDGSGRLHALRDLYVMDGSVFPTSIGTPPQLSIYAFAMKNARALAATL
jgi:choline dehydrogenase-like flavoprotein